MKRLFIFIGCALPLLNFVVILFYKKNGTYVLFKGEEWIFELVVILSIFYFPFISLVFPLAKQNFHKIEKTTSDFVTTLLFSYFIFDVFFIIVFHYFTMVFAVYVISFILLFIGHVKNYKI